MGRINELAERPLSRFREHVSTSPQPLEAAIGGQENIDLCFRSEYDFQLIAETYRELVKLVHNVPKFSTKFTFAS